MPQLIAMVIVVVGAMIYMFQTFGGTGDKIEGIAQKTSIITEINNIKDGIKISCKIWTNFTSSTVDGTGDTVIASSN
jgi:flagellar basal body-associated protein FliL